MNACIHPLSDLGRDCHSRSRSPVMGANRRNPSKYIQSRTYHVQAAERVQRGHGWVAVESIALSVFR
jgi:hypothetical protein